MPLLIFELPNFQTNFCFSRRCENLDFTVVQSCSAVVFYIMAYSPFFFAIFCCYIAASSEEQVKEEKEEKKRVLTRKVDVTYFK